MKITVTEYEKEYSFELAPVTQVCGQNIVKKSFVLESIKKYFSTYKYREEINKWRDNLKLDDEFVGRKFFSVIAVKSVEEILTMIKWSKQSLMVEYVKQLEQKFDWQEHLRVIGDELEEMFQLINSDINKLGSLELTFSMSDVWDMVQKSDVVGTDSVVLDDKEGYEVTMIFINFLEEVLKINPKKMIVILENMDHMISRKEYLAVVQRLQEVARKFNVYFIVSTSLDGYVACDREMCSGIIVFGEVDFQMPEFEKLSAYIINNYPCYKQISEEKLIGILVKIIQRIGRSDFLNSVEEDVVCKLINQTLMLYEKWEDNEKMPEIAFLKV